MGNYKCFNDLTSDGKRKRLKRTFKKPISSTQNKLPKVINEKTCTPDLRFDVALENEHVDLNNIQMISENSSLKEKLARWAVDNNIKRNALTSLLRILKNDKYSNLPSDSRTLLKTPRTIEITDMPPGKFIYIGIRPYLMKICKNNKITSILIDANIDGAPIYNNSYENGVIWPILCRVKNLNSGVFPVAIYCGKRKPNDFSFLLQPFVDEILSLSNSFIVNGNQVNVTLNNVICDAPARSSVCNITGHMALNGCPRCYAQANRIENRSIYLYHKENLRTNADFRQKIDESFHHGFSEFEKIQNHDMIYNFPIDYLHNCLLGIMKKLLEIWFGKKGLYSASTKARISEKISKFCLVQPTEFQRHCRNLEQMGIWKGSELRTFALFIGPCVLENEIAYDNYKHFMLFNIALTILIDDEFCVVLNSIAKEIAYKFIENVLEIYGTHITTYNFHLFTHLSDDCKRNGALDNFSSFPYESFLGRMKKLVQSPSNPLQQICNRVSEMLSLSNIELSLNNSIHYQLKNPDKTDANIYKQLLINNRLLCDNGKDSYVLCFDQTVVRTLSFFKNNNGMLIAKCQKFSKFSDIYSFPIESRDIDCFKVSLEYFTYVDIDVRKFKRKMYCTPVQGNNVTYMFPLCSFIKTEFHK